MRTTLSIPTSYRIAPIDLAGASDDAVRPFVELAWQEMEEDVPEDPRQPFEAIAGRMRASSPMFERWNWAAWEGETPVGRAFMQRSTQDNPNARQIHVMVRADHRRRGLGRALLAAAIEQLGKGEELTLISWTNSRNPAADAFAWSVGAEPKLRARSSQLELGSVDRQLVREWSSLDPVGYRLAWVDAETPTKLMDNVITAVRTMNTMPKEGLEVEDFVVTEESVREWERMSRERGQQRRLLLAIEESTGATAAFTEIFFHPGVPSVLHQGGTAVVPEHRGRGLGKWVKAQMVERILREMPDARYIRTDNAGSNAPMLSINVRMGFKPAWEEIIWQVPVPTVRARLEAARP